MHTDQTAAALVPEGVRPARRPVFIAGPDRSGTTLMFAILASHPDLCMVRRTNVWRYFDGRYGSLGRPENFERCLSDMVRYRRMRHLAPDADRIRREFSAGSRTYGRLFALFYEHHAERSMQPRWGDKSLHTEHYADRIFAEFPYATVVHMMRDPRDRYASVRRRNGGDLSRVGAATARWLESARAARRNLRRHPGRYLVVRYEDLVSEPEPTVRRVCDFIGAPFTAEMLSLNGLPELRDSGGNSSFGDMTPGSISTNAIGRFRDALRPDECAFIELVARRDMQAFGYASTGVAMTPRAQVAFFLVHLPFQGARMLAWLALARRMRARGERLPPTRLVAPPEERSA
jgi:hypothetical protein